MLIVLIVACCILPLIQFLIKRELATATGQFPEKTEEDKEQIMETEEAESEELGLTNRL